MNYIGITAVKNEERLLPSFLECLKQLTIRPLCWYIVDDGSIDSSVSIIKSFCDEVNWCTLIQLPYRRKRLRGPAVVNAMNKALMDATNLRFEYLVKVDVDINFNRDIVMTLIDRLEDDHRLGICGPELLIRRRGRYSIDRNLPDDFVRGAFRVYRYQCLLEQGGWEKRKGWDGIDQIRAKINKWKVLRFKDIVVYSVREEGNATGVIRSSIENGKGLYYIGGFWVYMLSEACEYSKRRPYLVRGLFMIVGFIWGRILNEKIKDENVKTFVKNQHVNLLRDGNNSLFNMFMK